MSDFEVHLLKPLENLIVARSDCSSGVGLRCISCSFGLTPQPLAVMALAAKYVVRALRFSRWYPVHRRWSSSSKHHLILAMVGARGDEKHLELKPGGKTFDNSAAGIIGGTSILVPPRLPRRQSWLDKLRPLHLGGLARVAPRLPSCLRRTYNLGAQILRVSLK
jgi:hypothetical protein